MPKKIVISKEKKIEAFYYKDLPRGENYVQFSPMLLDELWGKDISECFHYSDIVYKKHAQNYIENSDVSHLGTIKEKKYNCRAYAFLDRRTNRIYIAFKGTQITSVKTLIDDLGLLLGKPLSANGRVTAAMKKIVEAYPECPVILTGHSLGGSLATWFSHILNVPAIVFDSPGINKRINDSKVTSLQVDLSFVDKLPGAYKGNEIRLSPATSTWEYLSEFPVIGLIVSFTIHQLSNLAGALRRTYRLLVGKSDNPSLYEIISEKTVLKYPDTAVSKIIEKYLNVPCHNTRKDRHDLVGHFYRLHIDEGTMFESGFVGTYKDYRELVEREDWDRRLSAERGFLNGKNFETLEKRIKELGRSVVKRLRQENEGYFYIPLKRLECRHQVRKKPLQELEQIHTQRLQPDQDAAKLVNDAEYRAIVEKEYTKQKELYDKTHVNDDLEKLVLQLYQEQGLSIDSGDLAALDKQLKEGLMASETSASATSKSKSPSLSDVSFFSWRPVLTSEEKTEAISELTNS